MTAIVNNYEPAAKYEAADQSAEYSVGASPPEAKLQAGDRLRICLAGSGGGHVRQLLDLEGAWSPHEHFFVSEDTALSQSIAKNHRTHFVAHLALGQARLGSPLKMLAAAARNFVQTGKIMLAERPHLVISTGAGAVFFSVLWGRLVGAKVVTVESFARFHHPSVFARLTGPFANHKVVQSQALAKRYPEAAVFDPLQILDTPRPEKKPLLFATVGAILPFDRLVNMVAELKARGEIDEEVVIQTGTGGVAPEGVETHETLSFDEMQNRLRDADIVVCHGGTGSLITALRQGCRIVAVPRLFSQGEVYDDHQAQITKAFADRGLIAVANTVEELSEALKTVRSRPPILATSNPEELIAYLEELIEKETAARKLVRRPI